MKLPFANYWRITTLVVLLALALVSCGTQGSNSNGQLSVRLGYFPNLTHAVALVGVERGTFQNALGTRVTLEPKIFNAGPAEIEALFANEIDIGYVGPNPAINGYVKSHGEALRIIAGASSGGALFIVRPGANIKSPQDLSGKKIATPQLGGTQDVALRYYLQQHGFLDERSLWSGGKFVTTEVISSKKFLDQHPDLVSKFLQAHVDTVEYILSHPGDTQSIVNSEIKRITGKALASQELALAYTHLDITYDPLTGTLQESADRAYALGFLGQSKPDLNSIYFLGPLNQVLSSRGLATVAGP